MSLFFAELRKVWGNRLFPLLLAVLAAANLLLLWMGTRPTTGQPHRSVLEFSKKQTHLPS